jgi:threonine/homoserine/homoserine lactone efflux protein
LLVAGLSAVVGVADQLRALMWLAVLGTGSQNIAVAQVCIKLASWVLLGWLAYRAIRQNLGPPGWALCAIPVLVWSYTLWPS